MRYQKRAFSVSLLRRSISCHHKETSCQINRLVSIWWRLWSLVDKECQKVICRINRWHCKGIVSVFYAIFYPYNFKILKASSLSLKILLMHLYWRDLTHLNFGMFLFSPGERWYNVTQRREIYDINNMKFGHLTH